MALWQDTCFKLVIPQSIPQFHCTNIYLGELKKKQTNNNSICFNLLPALVPSLTYCYFSFKGVFANKYDIQA